MWKSILRENLGFIFTFAIFILFRRRQHLVQSFQKMVNSGMTYLHRLFCAPTIYSSSVITPSTPHPRSYDSKYPNSVLYFRRRFFGTEYFVVKSAYVANTLAEHADYFENVSFANRIFRLCRRSNTAKGLERVIKTHISAGDSSRGEVGGCKTLSTTAAEAYQKFAMEMNATGEQKVGHHLYQTFEDGGKEQLMELPTLFEAKNGGFHLRLMETIVPELKSCIKELVVLLEAKANRRNEIDIRQYGYKHAVNILGVAFFGQSIEQLTSSGCEFYSRFDELYGMWLRAEEGKSIFPAWFRRSNKSTRSDEVMEFFKNMVVECVNQRSGNKCLLRSLVEKCEPVGESRDELIETLSEFAMAFSIYSAEVLAGAISIILHELARDTHMQEKIRDKDKVNFSLEGLPQINAEFLSEPLYIESLIKETFTTFPIDPLIQLSCKRVYRIPNTSFRINPKSVVLIPVNVLQTDNNLYPSMDSSDLSVNQQMEKEYAFITDSEMQSFFVFANQFVDICLKATLPSIIQIYEFKTDMKLNYEYGTSCRFSTLPSALPLRTCKVEKRGKIVVFEESLKAFHASKGVPFLSKIGL